MSDLASYKAPFFLRNRGEGGRYGSFETAEEALHYIEQNPHYMSIIDAQLFEWVKSEDGSHKQIPDHLWKPGLYVVMEDESNDESEESTQGEAKEDECYLTCISIAIIIFLFGVLCGWILAQIC